MSFPFPRQEIRRADPDFHVSSARSLILVQRALQVAPRTLKRPHLPQTRDLLADPDRRVYPTSRAQLAMLWAQRPVQQLEVQLAPSPLERKAKRVRKRKREDGEEEMKTKAKEVLEEESRTLLKVLSTKLLCSTALPDHQTA